jgi:hypothetical protein
MEALEALPNVRLPAAAEDEADVLVRVAVPE